jgi:hypothetical protein
VCLRRTLEQQHYQKYSYTPLHHSYHLDPMAEGNWTRELERFSINQILHTVRTNEAYNFNIQQHLDVIEEREREIQNDEDITSLEYDNKNRQWEIIILPHTFIYLQEYRVGNNVSLLGYSYIQEESTNEPSEAYMKKQLNFAGYDYDIFSHNDIKNQYMRHFQQHPISYTRIKTPLKLKELLKAYLLTLGYWQIRFQQVHPYLKEKDNIFKGCINVYVNNEDIKLERNIEAFNQGLYPGIRCPSPIDECDGWDGYEDNMSLDYTIHSCDGRS